MSGGSPALCAAAGWVARCTVERLRCGLGSEGVEPSAPRPPDLVDRDFTAVRPNQL